MKLAKLGRRRPIARRTIAGICEGGSAWAAALDQTMIAHDPSSVQRIGSVVWSAARATLE